MKKNKYPVTVDGEQYCIWMWKGDYLNLGAGTETGIYKGGEPFWDVSAEDADRKALYLRITELYKNGMSDRFPTGQWSETSSPWMTKCSHAS